MTPAGRELAKAHAKARAQTMRKAGAASSSSSSSSCPASCGGSSGGGGGGGGETNATDPLMSKEAFASAFNDVIGGGPAKRLERMRAKSAVLRDMAMRGIVFADVSPVAIYTPSKKKMCINQRTGTNEPSQAGRYEL